MEINNPKRISPLLANTGEMKENKSEMILQSTKTTFMESICGFFLRVFSLLLIIFTFPISLLFVVKVIMQYQRVIIFRLGRISGSGPSGPGLFCIIPCTDTLQLVDIRTITFDVPPQEILTKDAVTVTVDAVVFYRIFDPISSVMIENCKKSTQLLASAILRNILGTYSLGDILKEKESISSAISEQLDKVTDEWGIKVEAMEIKDVRIPRDMQRAMAAEAEAHREANAKIIAANGEKDSATALKEASDIISHAPMAMQLRYLQTLNTIAAEKNSTIIFPIPLEFSKMLSK